MSGQIEIPMIIFFSFPNNEGVYIYFTQSYIRGMNVDYLGGSPEERTA